MTKSLVAAALAVTLGSLAGFAAAQVKPEIMVKQRQSAMALIGKYWGPIAGMASGKVSPYNADVISRNATYLENLKKSPYFAEPVFKNLGREAGPQGIYQWEMAVTFTHGKTAAAPGTPAAPGKPGTKPAGAPGARTGA